MARLARLYAPEIPQLLQARFVPEQPGRLRNLERAAHWMTEELRSRDVSLHAWVVLPDAWVALATPGGPKDLPGLVQAVGKRLAVDWGGAVFAARYRSALVEPGNWVLRAMLWLESLPVQSGLVGDAEQWRLGSAPNHTGAAANALITDHPDYWAYGNTPFDRQARYRRALQDGLAADTRQQIEQALYGQWALGDAAFIGSLDSGARRAAPAKRGRPPRPSTEPH
jgi:putative transposase